MIMRYLGTVGKPLCISAKEDGETTDEKGNHRLHRLLLFLFFGTESPFSSLREGGGRGCNFVFLRRSQYYSAQLRTLYEDDIMPFLLGYNIHLLLNLPG
jgi:hypothetical protein